MTYTIEGWSSINNCVGFTTRVRPTAVIRQAQHYALDKGAETVWVHRDGRVVYTFDGMHWRKYAGDDALAAALDAE